MFPHSHSLSRDPFLLGFLPVLIFLSDLINDKNQNRFLSIHCSAGALSSPVIKSFPYQHLFITLSLLWLKTCSFCSRIYIPKQQKSEAFWTRVCKCAPLNFRLEFLRWNIFYIVNYIPFKMPTICSFVKMLLILITDNSVSAADLVITPWLITLLFLSLLSATSSHYTAAIRHLLLLILIPLVFRLLLLFIPHFRASPSFFTSPNLFWTLSVLSPSVFFGYSLGVQNGIPLELVKWLQNPKNLIRIPKRNWIGFLEKCAETIEYFLRTSTHFLSLSLNCECSRWAISSRVQNSGKSDSESSDDVFWNHEDVDLLENLILSFWMVQTIFFSAPSPSHTLSGPPTSSFSQWFPDSPRPVIPSTLPLFSG